MNSLSLVLQDQQCRRLPDKKATREGAHCYCRHNSNGNEGNKERQRREGACCGRRMTCECQQKVGKNEGAISGCRRTCDNDNGHQGKATKKEIVAAVVKLEAAKTATTERQQEKGNKRRSLLQLSLD